MRRFRTIGQRRHRRRKAQVAAVATVFGLLLVVDALAQFALAPLPGLERNAEFNHQLLVQNQLSGLSASVLALSQHPTYPLSVLVPITLGSSAVPPFGPPSGGSVSPETGSALATASYAISEIVPAEPNWNTGSACLLGGAGNCAGNGNIDTWNVTNTNGSAFTIKVTGGSNSLAYRLNGNNDTVTVTWSGQNLGFVDFVINGSNDVVNFDKSGSTSSSPVASFLFYGQSDTFNYDPSGSSSGSGGFTVYVQFVGSLSGICPYANLASTDKVGTLASGGTNLNFTVVWFNALGIVNGPHRQTYPGGAGSNETINWWNTSALVNCAFTRAYSSHYQANFGSGLSVHLLNRYLAPTDVVYDQGAVIVGSEGGTPLMVSPPDLTFGRLPAGYFATLTLINTIGNFTSVSGYGTAGVAVRLVQTSSFTIQNGQTSTSLGSAIFLNLTTAYPAAWVRYLSSIPQIVPYGAHCISSSAVSPPYSCLNPPPGVLVQVSAAISVVQLTFTTITVALTVQ